MQYKISCFLLFLFISFPLWAQPEMVRVKDEGIPFFHFEAGNMASKSKDLSTIAINVKIPFDELQFIKTSDTLFQAEVELTFVVFDSDNDQVEGKSFKEKVTAKNYDQTNSNKIYFSFDTTVDLPPEEYSLLCQVTDLDSRKTGNKKEKVVLKNFASESLDVSDLFVQNVQDITEGELDQIYSIFSETVSDSAEFLVASLHVYSSHETDRLRVKYNIKNFRKKITQEGKFEVPNLGFGTKLNIPILKKGLSVGNYMIDLKINDGEETIDMNDVFRTNVANLPITIGNLDLAIEQMQYIADKSDIKRIKKTPEDQRQAAFDAYWKKNDPTPGSDTNELMDEYYRRIAFTNAHFSAFRDGWKTDMGHVYILFGPPSDVDRQPYNVNSSTYFRTEVFAYELWYYYDLNRRFDFADEHGFGDYRLLNPQEIYRSR